MELWPSIAEYFIYDDILYYVMTNDKRRNNHYKAAINKHVKDKIVVDIGTGEDAILSRFCIEAGAKRVYAIEILERSYKKAKAKIEKFGLQDKIILIHGDSTKIELPEKVDVCLSEIVGTIGGAEGSAAILNNAWRFLKEGGIMIPLKSTTKIAAITFPDYFVDNLGFSKLASDYVAKVFEYVGRKFDLRICIKNFDKNYLISNIEMFEDLDYSGLVKLEESHDIRLEITSNSKIQGFLVWLNLFTIEDVVIDILEYDYCWLPVFLPVFYPGINVLKGDKIIAKCERALCDNGINTDYKLTGYLLKNNSDIIPFEYSMDYFEKNYLKSAFYRQILHDKHKCQVKP